MDASLKVKGIVTRAVPYHESDMIITLVTVEYGAITATARGCLKPKAKLRYSAEPLNFGDYVLSGKNGRYVVTECSQIDSFLPITMDIEKYYAGAFVLETLQKLSREQNPELFVNALKTLTALAYEPCDSDDVIRDFLLTLLKDNGNEIDFANCAICKCALEGDVYFKDTEGVVCEHCKGIDGYIPIDNVTRAYLVGEENNISHVLKTKANILLLDMVYIMLGVKISTHYFTEQI